MKTTLTTIFTIASLIIILDSVNFGHSLAMLLLAGVIPGTSTTIDANNMLMITSGLTGFVLARVSMHLIVTARRQSVQYSQPKAATPAV